MMVDDYQGKILSKLQDLAKDIRTLKGRVTKLQSRVQDLELLDFQQQITKLDNDLSAVANGVLQVQRHSAWVDVVTLNAGFIAWLNELARAQPTFNIASSREYAFHQSGIATQQIANSLDPISVSHWFRTTLAEYCKQRNLPYFVGTA